MEERGRQHAKSISAFVLCGGFGTRLRAVLPDRPKAMAQIAGTPFLQLILNRLRQQGIRSVILGTGYQAEQIEQFFGNGGEAGMNIRYSREETPLGTGGAVKLAESQLSDPALVLNGDSYAEWELLPMLDLLLAKEADLVMLLQKVSDAGRYGSVILEQGHRVSDFMEKEGTRVPG